MNYPPATILQLAIPIYGSVYEVKNYFRSNDIKMLLGTYLTRTHYCALIFGIKHYGSSEEEIGNDPSINQIVGSYYNGNMELHFVHDGSKLKVKLPDNQFYPGWHAIDRVNESSNTFEYWSPDGSYQFRYYNDEYSEYIILQTWYSDGKTMKFCKDFPCK